MAWDERRWLVLPAMNSSSFHSLPQHPAACRLIAFRSFAWAGRVLAATLLGGFATTGAPAQTSSTGAVIPGNAPPPVISQPETFYSGPSLGPSGRPPSSDSFTLPGTYSNWSGRSQPPGPFFLPVLLPVLGAPPPVGQAALAADHPRGFAANYPRAFAGEPFFMAYGNLAAHRLVSVKRAERIARYQAARLALLTELRGQLSRGPDASPEARARTLADLAATQTPQLLALEAEAEQIRYDLTHLGFLTTTADDIGYLRPTGEDPNLRVPLASVRLLLSAAHFQEGLSPDQRRLVEEMAQEVQLTIEPDSGAPAAVFFWPAGARIPVPAGLPPEAAARFDDFQRRKTALKNELRALLVREDGRVFVGERTEAYLQLASAQAPRFAELDALADSIRPALAALADASPASELPADLARQVAGVVHRKAALQRELHARLTAFRRELPADHLVLTRQGHGLAITVSPGGHADSYDDDPSIIGGAATGSVRPRDRQTVLADLAAFNGETSSRFDTLAADLDAVRAALARYQASVPVAKAGRTVDQLAADFLAAYEAREHRNRQRDYAAAVLAPDLSPAQRRLLLAAAAVDFLREPSSPAR